MIWRKKEIVEKRTVLFVDDDEIVLRSLERDLLDENELFDQLFAKSGQEALEILQKEQVHVMATDMCMPDMDGLELLKIVRQKYPHIVMIVLSRYTDMPAILEEFEEGEIFEFVPKPWKLKQDFQNIVLRAIEHYNLQSKHNAVRQPNLLGVK